jgi:hypothetical protein
MSIIPGKGVCMRFRILGLSMAALAIAPAIVMAALCDDTYNLQTVSQTSFEGTDANGLTRTDTKSVSANLSDLKVLDNLMRYGVITRFEGSCAKAAKPVTMKVKERNATAFADSVDNGYSIQMFDSNSLVGTKKFDYWFGFFKPADTLRIYLGRTNAEGDGFSNWYAGVFYTDSTKNESSGLWTVQSHFYDLTGPDDSISLERQFLDQTIRKLPANGANYRAHYRVQFLKVSYENKPAPIRVAPPARSALPNGFLASQTGNLVLIQPGDKSLNGQPLSLLGMLGNRIATLHPTGYLYQWNGKTAVGADAPTGVYFVQAGNRVLGKFFYAR